MMRLLAPLAALLTLTTTHIGAAIPPITADGLVLIVNRQQPAGRALAERYAELRHVPADRIIEIDVPDTVEIAPDVYEKSIAAVIRHEVDARQLRERAQCLITFYGVPLRVKDREYTAAELNEVNSVLRPTVGVLSAQFKKAIEAVEVVARDADPSFRPDVAATNNEQLRVRGVAAESAISNALAKLAEPARSQLNARLNTARALLHQMPITPAAPSKKPTTLPTQQQVNTWLALPDDAAARKQLREALYSAGNIFPLLMVADSQLRTLHGGEGEASVDSELSCLWLGEYPRQKWVVNPWHWSATEASGDPLRKKMIRVTRLDGPTPEIARRVFEEAIAVEPRGLSGDFLFDARGMTGIGGPGSYDSCDQAIRNASKFFGAVDGLKLVFDNNPGLMPDHSSDHAAVYCGWYAARQYHPTAAFLPGSVAWHVASYELLSLRGQEETGWCRGLLLAGADVTLGPVSEPYLIAFPPPDEFLGLLATGKCSVGEAYWATLPVTSWKMVLIGDPLYRPFARKPAINSSALPASLAKLIAD